MTSWQGALALAIALVVALAMNAALRVPAAPGQNSALAGLRGFLAFGVFLHHGVVWYFYLHDAGWGRPPLAVYRELGLDCVNVFFMITAFLFVGKVMDGRHQPIDWLRLYVGRFLRVVPLYLLVVSVLLMIVGCATAWQLQEPLSALFLHAGEWLLFGMAPTTSVNGYPLTGTLIAFVTWTLAYEWLFYFSLPIVALALGVRVPIGLVVFTSLAMLAVASGVPSLFLPFSFVIGALVAAISRSVRVAAVLRSGWLAGAGLLAIAILLAGIVPHRASLLVEGLVFCIIACGNTLFGILSNRAAVGLGEISYGIYLVHSLVLSTTVLFVLGPDRVHAMTPAMFWGLLIAVGAIVVAISALTYRYVEMPSLRQTGAVSARIRDWVRARVARRDPVFSDSAL